MIYLLYIIFSFLILRFSVTLFNFISNPKLGNSVKQYDELVSVLIPARNEQADILNLLQSLKSQNYQNIEVIVLDDSSSDATLQISRDFCATDNRFKTIIGNPLPNNWLGKNYACHQLAQQAKGNYLLFLDADETVKNNLINNALHRMVLGKLALLSLFANQITLTLGEKLVVPLMHYLLLNLLPLRLVKLSSNPAFAAASGQFMFFNAQIYKQNLWHQQVKNKVVEDIEIMKTIKQNGFTGETLLANHFLYCRMYKSYKQSLNGFSKNLLAGFGGSVLGLLAFVLLICFGLPFISIYANTGLMVFALILIISNRLLISMLSNQHIFYNIILNCGQIVTLLLLTIISIYKSLTKKQVWKGRIIKNDF